MSGIPPIGQECMLYYSTSFATPTHVLIAKAIDVSLPSITKTKVAVPSRMSKWNGKRGGLRELTLEFGYRYERGTDTVLAALRASFLDDTPLVFWVLDGAINTAGSQGFVFPGQVFDFPIDQQLEQGQQINIGVEFTHYRESNNLVLPAWHVVAGT